MTEALVIAISDDPGNVSAESDTTSNFTTSTNNKPVVRKNDDARSESSLDVLPVYYTRAVDKAQSLHGVIGEIRSERASNIIALYQQHELGKAILGFAIPVSTGLLALYSKFSPLVVNLVVVSLCFGFACIWNGLLLRALLPGLAIRLEQFGVALVLAAFFGLVSTFVPVYLIWAPWACWALSLVPFALTLF